MISELAAPELTIRGEQLLLTVMLRNLLHNAIRYGKPAGGTVQLTLTPQQLVIEDDGPRDSDAILAAAGERFTGRRGQENRQRSGIVYR